MTLSKTAFRQALRDEDFTGLFLECGWDKPTGAAVQPLEIAVPGEAARRSFAFREAARKCGVRVWTCSCEALPEAAVCRALDVKLRKFSDFYLAVFVKKGEALRHLWVVPVKNVDKRGLVKVQYEQEEQTDFLHSRVASIAFPLDAEVELVDVLDKIAAAFRLNATEITKKFYREFKQQHSLFVQGIRNILQDNERVWYASIMLNRLMFCYFIQKKGFLNNDPEYLVHKLKEVQAKQGANKFYGSFYKTFLRALFQEGLNRPDHDTPEFRAVFGRIPYLNGGMFEQHAIERDNPDLDIPDSVFERLFAFFDEWRWHLDTRISATGRDINPDVLGYIFEQYINDRAQMGAYYTKEDITEYIGRSTIVPFLLDAVAKKSPKAFAKNGFVWKTMRESGDRYIFPAVRKGVDAPLPDHIQQGVDTDRPGLLERRGRWNEKADPALALPTEIWRETVARRLRCAELRRKIKGGEILSANDLITCNLNIRLFAEDLLNNTDDHLFIRHFYEALRSVTILDPTCGSGAFLFAALNILEPLYEICIQRMQDDFSAAFKDELAELKNAYKGNLQYFIYKNIILRNLHGVDIMREATEIARLRLFLKIVAVVDVNRKDPNLGLEPLPDIDFNVRCGNTLVGYASEKEIEAGVQNSGVFIWHDMHQIIEDELNKVRLAAKQFRDAQLLDDKPEVLLAAKRELGERLGTIRKLLDNQLHQSNGTGKSFEDWHADTLPFHWYAEFYDILVEHGGFDVIIGNPPYLEARQIHYGIENYLSLNTGAVHAFCMERATKLLNNSSYYGMIVPMALPSTQRMKVVQDLLEDKRDAWYANYSWRPAKLFDTVNRALTIFITAPNNLCKTFSTNYQKWVSESREGLYERIVFVEVPRQRPSCWVPKLGDDIEKTILSKMLVHSGKLLGRMFVSSGSKVFYRTDGGLYWKVFTDFAPRFVLNGVEGHSSRETSFQVDNHTSSTVIIATLSSDIFWWWYTITSNIRHLNPFDIQNFPFPTSLLSDNLLVELGNNYLKDLINNSTMLTRMQTRTGRTETQSFTIKLSKHIINEIDAVLAKHYNLTEEELDFIINYDIKYRMGDELAESEG